MIAMIDNYDSFTYNLVQELSQITGEEIQVVRNDQVSTAEVLDWNPSAVVISPGPGEPKDAGITMDLVRAAEAVPLLGICLGLQALAAVHGASIVRAPEPVHGKTSPIVHAGKGLFAGLESPIEATRYHSLVIDRTSLPAELEVTAWTSDNVVMGIQHTRKNHHGVQFHPESYLTRDGMRLLAQFLLLAGISVRDEWRSLKEEHA
ncbi:MAG: aminodeoxychorismate/anthranilate synthase component II [bacterium]|nr:aminodeoxychorismate/anthranilate synthase component II [bacterium]